MRLDEVGLIIDYFHGATPEHLETLGVDPTRLPDPARWRERSAQDYARPHRERGETLALERLFCEPSAFNVAPNRTPQRAGFRYVKTHMAVPGWLNHHQAVTRWVLERHDLTA